MSFTKSVFFTLASASFLSVASAAHANTKTYIVDAKSVLTINDQPSAHVGDRYFGSSETASFYFKTGVTAFEKGNTEKALYAFKASMRADGSAKLDKITLHYLAYINERQGNHALAKEYAEAYFKMGNN